MAKSKLCIEHHEKLIKLEQLIKINITKLSKLEKLLYFCTGALAVLLGIDVGIDKVVPLFIAIG